ncbi:GAF domain-containing protein [Kovacikia minuta CCNUW1]|uniref:adenylate/guanylate cyclase domain-containing protein n=1 Tax=Kovacikia minuta TaxID=2931930 RepID=UPI001CCB43AD|nr:adenylate/guanylate cyclase domain-containing protein [Kovacikia minuta]UBF24395.1 GAF domain-containing protein [Kovacikia minuta CCNUW1]
MISSSEPPPNEALTAQNPEQLLQTTRQLLANVQALSSRVVTIHEIALAINRSLNLEEILQVVGKQAKWLLDFDHLSIFLWHQDSYQLKTLFGSPLELNQAAIAPTGFIGLTLDSGKPQLVQEGSPISLPVYASGLIVPLENQRQIIGTINFATRQANAYTLDDSRIGYLLALQIAAAIQNAARFEELNQLYSQLEVEKSKSDQLLLNILPVEVASELKHFGKVKPVYYESASVLFTDFKDFTKLSQKMAPEVLVAELDHCFSYFDRIVEKYNLEKLKTIGDSYMCAGGIPTPNRTHAVDTVLAAIEMQLFMHLHKAQKIKQNQPYWDIRIGVHSGPLLAGVIGQKKFAYDVWGDTVNTASRMESCGIPGRVNISQATFSAIKDFFQFEYRGKVAAKNKGEIDMYLVTGIKHHLAIDPVGLLPNDEFVELYMAIHSDRAIAPPFCQWTSARNPKPLSVPA